MKTKHLRPKAIYQDTARVGRRIITMIADGYVFYTVVRQGCNEYMVDNCHALIALWDGTSGGTANCVSYAKAQGRFTHNLWSSWV